VGESTDHYKFDSFGHHIQFARNTYANLIVTDGRPEVVSAEEWENQLDKRLQSEVAHLSDRVAHQKGEQSEFETENGGLFGGKSFVRWTSDFGGGVTAPETTLWQKSETALAKLEASRKSGQWTEAYAALQETRRHERQAGLTWRRYIDGTLAGAETADSLRHELQGDVAMAGAAGAAVAVAIPVATVMAGAAVAAGASTAVTTAVAVGTGLLAGTVTGGAAGGTNALIAEGFNAVSTESPYDVDAPFVTRSVLGGAVWGGLVGGSAGVLTSRLVVTGALDVASQYPVASQLTRGFATKAVEMGRAAVTALRSPRFWGKFLKVGGVSGTARLAYDTAEVQITGQSKDFTTVAKNAGFAFVGGGFCGSIYSGMLAYNYIGLDLLGDFSHHYLTDVREKYGNAKGLALSGGLLAVEGGLATWSFVPYLGSWQKALKVVLFADVVSIGLESWIQHSGGRDWQDIDTGRLVGMSAWGHSVVLLPEAIRAGAVQAVGLAAKAAQTAELGVKYLLFVNPSVNNFSARVNHQNWNNVQVGNTLRHGTLMWASRVVQTMMGPSHPASILVDEGLGLVTIDMVNRLFPYYEGIQEIWRKGLLKKIQESGKGEAFDSLTHYLSREMGSVSLVDGGVYMPSNENLEKAAELLAQDPEAEASLVLFLQYIDYLKKKGEKRTPQEERIYQHFLKIYSAV